MDLTTLLGITFGAASLLTAFLIEGGHINQLIAPTALLIIFGGTFGATAASFSSSQLKQVVPAIRALLFHRLPDEVTVIRQIVAMAEKARREGLLSLEKQLDEVEDPFMRKGLQLVVDGTEPETVRSILEIEMYSLSERHRVAQEIFEAAGGYAPTMGIIGTVLGLIHVLSSLSSPEKLGPAIALAFTATLWGVSTANVLWFPIGTRLKNISRHEAQIRELMLEGILALQAGNNPIMITERLTAFLSPREREAAKPEGAPGAEVYGAS